MGASDAFTNPEVLTTHANARLTPRGRRLIIERSHAGWKQAHIAAAMGVSRRCVKRWLDRYAPEGAAGLGHADVAFTMKQYVQTDLEADREVANTLADLILGGMLVTDDVIDQGAEDSGNRPR